MSASPPLLDILGRLPLLADLEPPELASIGKGLVERWAQEGDVVVLEGDRSEGLSFILSGQVSVRRSGVEQTRLGPGDIFGEMSTLLGERAVADLVALGPVHYVVIPAADCEGFLARHSRFTFHLLQAEARRLRNPGQWYAGAVDRRQQVATSDETGWTPASWRRHPARQQPTWPDAAELDRVLAVIAAKPPLIFAAEARDLKASLAEVAAGRAFLLQAGDCAESFDEFSADSILSKLKVTLQMAAVLSYACGVRVVKVGRIAGTASAEARLPEPGRMLSAYEQSAETMNLVRALTMGGFASLHRAQGWNSEFVKSSREGQRYESIARDIERSLQFMSACGIEAEKEAALRQAQYWTSHEALLLPYEEALTRRDSLTGEWYDCSGHMLWIGERTRDVDGAHMEFLSGVENPLGCKLGPSATVDEVLAICRRLNPDRVPGRLTLISRMGAGRVVDCLPPLLAAVRNAGHPVVWACDPMHGNTVVASGGRKTRRFDDILAETYGFFAACASEGTWPGGLHLELTGDDVTECLGGAEEIREDDLDAHYTTACDPRLNGRQSLDLAFQVAELLLASGRRDVSFDGR